MAPLPNRNLTVLYIEAAWYAVRQARQGAEGPYDELSRAMLPLRYTGQSIELVIWFSKDCASLEYCFQVACDLCATPVSCVFLISVLLQGQILRGQILRRCSVCRTFEIKAGTSAPHQDATASATRGAHSQCFANARSLTQSPTIGRSC